MQIEVTQEDIEQGLPHRCLRCPVSLAVRRAVMANPVVAARAAHWDSVICDFMAVIAGRSQIKVIAGFEAFEFDTPGAVQTFMRRFDSYEKVEPLSFTLAPFNPFVFEPASSDKQQTDSNGGAR